MGIYLLLDYVIAFIFLIWFFILFYQSIEKCFRKEGKSKAILFFLSFLTNPYLVLVLAVLLTGLVTNLLFPTSMIEQLRTLSFSPLMLFNSFLFAGIYLGLVILSALLVGKWLGQEKKQPILFLYLMFATISVLMNRGSGSGMMFNVPNLREIIDIVGTLILTLAVWLFYRLDVKALAVIAKVRVEVSWKVFLVPPAVFTALYLLMSNFIATKSLKSQEAVILVLYMFSTIIEFLFVWAFYVIIKNINATNEAVMAKDALKELSVEVMEALAHTIDAKDEYTRGHSVRVAKYSRMIARKMGMSPEDCENAYYMGLLHDLGKIGVPNEIINSPTKLTEEQYAVIKTHPGLGFDILSEIKSRPDLVIGARWHHERYDGKGYPDGKSGKDIPLMARIIAVADSYDAMTSNRSYRSHLPQDRVCAEIEKNSGTQFDPEIAKCMIAIIKEDVNYELHE